MYNKYLQSLLNNANFLVLPTEFLVQGIQDKTAESAFFFFFFLTALSSAFYLSGLRITSQEILP